MKCRMLILLLCANGLLHAQEYRKKAELQPVPQTGFYQLELSPQMTAESNAELSDIRILDEKKAQAPYVIRHSRPSVNRGGFIEFPILAVRNDSNRTIIEMEGKQHEGTGDLSLLIANTAVQRRASLSGSPDRKNWFIIEEGITLTNTGNGEGTAFLQVVRFPFVRYSFLKLEINNEKTDPLNILKAGILRNSPEEDSTQYIRNNPVRFTQKDSNRRTYIQIQQGAPYPVHRIRLQIEGPEFYKRNAELWIPSGGAQPASFRFSSSFSSDHPAEIKLDGGKYGRLLIVIDNGDNSPLKITGVVAEQEKKTLVAYLDKDRKYTLFLGNPDAVKPEYDLHEFMNRIPANPRPVAVAALQDNIQSTRAGSIFKKSFFWIAVAAGIVILGFLSYRLVEDMKREGGKK